MTRVDFYLFDCTSPEEVLQHVCRLVEKAYRGGHRICVQTASAAQAEALNELLWSYRGDSFLPHSLDVSHADYILISCDEVGDHCDVMVNLARAVPDQFSRFHRLAEVVCQHPDWLAASRERYAHYKNRGYPLNTHRIEG